jgi:hypothetical protein
MTFMELRSQAARILAGIMDRKSQLLSQHGRQPRQLSTTSTLTMCDPVLVCKVLQYDSDSNEVPKISPYWLGRKPPLTTKVTRLASNAVAPSARSTGVLSIAARFCMEWQPTMHSTRIAIHKANPI